MKSPEVLIKNFYEAFANNDLEQMMACYHPEIIFEDPVFRKLKGTEVKYMWEMLLLRSNGQLKISFEQIKASESNGSAKWKAVYPFGKKKRKVINHVTAQFTFKDGLIYRHFDHFDLWKWSRQALGLPGFFFGWTKFMQDRIHQTTKSLLDQYIRKRLHEAASDNL